MLNGGPGVNEATASLRASAELARAHRLEELSRLYEDFGDRIYAHVYRMLGNRQDAEDVTQETFLRALKSIEQLRQEDRLTSWLYSIASNLCIDHIRRRRRLWWLPLPARDGDLPETAGSDLPAVVENGDLVRRALRTLSPKDALCLVLRTAEGFSCTEIAAIMGCSESAVWSRLARARAAFSEAYERMARDVEETR